jgi:hypothetical protein
MSEMVERVMAAVEYEEFRIVAGRTPQMRVEAMALAAIKAMREPTEAMVEFGDAVRGNHADYTGGNGTANIFRSMIDEALK